MDRALSAYTAGVAVQAFTGQAGPEWGTIVPGASADLVWLERDPRSVAALDVPGIGIRGHVFAGGTSLLGSLRRSGDVYYPVHQPAD